MDIQAGIVGGDQLGINRNSPPEAAFNSFPTLKCTVLGVGDVDVLKLCPVEATTTYSSFTSVAGRAIDNQGFQVPNLGSKLVLDNLSCNFYDLYARLLKELKEDFKLMSHSGGSNINVNVLGQDEQQNHLCHATRV